MKTMRANGTIRTSRFVKVDVADNNSCKECDANELPIGISAEAGRTAPIPSVTTSPVEAAQSGEDVAIYGPGMVDSCLLRAGTGGWTAGDELEADADGNGVTAGTTADSTRYIGAIAQETVSAGEFGKVIPVLYAKKIAA